MLDNAQAVTVFAAFGIGSQVVLVAFFSARRWAPVLADRFGWIAYAFAGLGVPIGVWLLASGQSWRLWLGPLLMATWAFFGAYVDIWSPRQWRWPIVWSVFAPYLALYFWAQMCMWWPLWDFNRTAWVCYLVLFVINTALNLRGHFGEEATA